MSSGRATYSTWSRWVQVAIRTSDTRVGSLELPACSSRQPHGEDGTARRGVDRERPIVSVDDDAARGRQPEPGALADVLRRVEGVEDPLALPGRDARAVVGDLHERVVAVARGAHGDPPVLPERVDRIVNQVGPHLVELGSPYGQPPEVPII